MPATKLSLGEVLSESFGFFFSNLRLFFDLVTIPWIISLAIRALGAALAGESLASFFVVKLLDVVPTVMFMVAWQRAVLLGPRRIDRLPGLGWSARESNYLVHLAKVAGVAFLLISAFIFTIDSLNPAEIASGMPLDPEQARRQTTAAPIAIGFLVSLVLALRVSYGLAATAVDVPFSPRLSWAHSRGNAWTIIASLFLMGFVGMIATTLATLLALGVMRGVFAAREAAAFVAWTVLTLVSYGGAALAATVQAMIFRRLLGWREGASLPALS